MTASQIRDRAFAHVVGATLAMGVVVWWLTIPMIAASGPWWAR
jgi:hypothetical protein